MGVGSADYHGLRVSSTPVPLPDKTSTSPSDMWRMADEFFRRWENRPGCDEEISPDPIIARERVMHPDGCANSPAMALVRSGDLDQMACLLKLSSSRVRTDGRFVDQGTRCMPLIGRVGRAGRGENG